MPYGRMAESIAAEWRTLERSLLALPCASTEAVNLRAELAQLLDEYRRLFDDAIVHLPSMPVIPGDVGDDLTN